MIEPILPCDTCGGPGWFFDDVYGLGACATCNDDEHNPRPVSLGLRPRKPPEPWRPAEEPFNGECEYACAQCGAVVVLEVISERLPGSWWVCRCLAVAETAAGTVVLKFPQPVRLA